MGARYARSCRYQHIHAITSTSWMCGSPTHRFRDWFYGVSVDVMVAIRDGYGGDGGGDGGGGGAMAALR